MSNSVWQSLRFVRILHMVFSYATPLTAFAVVASNAYGCSKPMVALAVPILGICSVVFMYCESALRAKAEEADKQDARLWRQQSEQRAAALDERTSQREIVGEKKDRFLEALRGVPPAKIAVVYAETDSEAAKFAQQIADTLRLVKWDVDEPRGLPKKELRGIVGLVVKVRDQHNKPPWVAPLCKAFGEMEFPMAVGWHGNSVAAIYVGTKPPQE